MNINDRILELRKNTLNLSQENFAKKLGITKSSISKIEKGENNVSDRMVLSVCREFNVNEEWLRTGEGEMFNKESIDEEIAGFIGSTLAEEDNSFKRAFILALSKLNTDEWKLIENFIDEIKKNRADEISTAEKITVSDETQPEYDEEIEKELQAYRQELEAERKGKTYTVSDDTKNA